MEICNSCIESDYENKIESQIPNNCETDIYLTGDLNIHFFKSTYRLYTNFAMEGGYNGFIERMQPEEKPIKKIKKKYRKPIEERSIYHNIYDVIDLGNVFHNGTQRLS
jgi:hypothetical protein